MKKIISAYGAFWNGYLDFKGRTDRTGYWLAFLANFVVTFVVFGLIAAIFPLSASDTISGLWTLACLCPGLAIAVRRLRDSGKRWTYIFIALIPVVGAILLIVQLCKPSAGDKKVPAESVAIRAVPEPLQETAVACAAEKAPVVQTAVENVPPQNPVPEKISTCREHDSFLYEKGKFTCKTCGREMSFDELTDSEQSGALAECSVSDLIDLLPRPEAGQYLPKICDCLVCYLQAAQAVGDMKTVKMALAAIADEETAEHFAQAGVDLSMDLAEPIFQKIVQQYLSGRTATAPLTAAGKEIPVDAPVPAEIGEETPSASNTEIALRRPKKNKKLWIGISCGIVALIVIIVLLAGRNPYKRMSEDEIWEKYNAYFNGEYIEQTSIEELITELCAVERYPIAAQLIEKYSDDWAAFSYGQLLEWMGDHPLLLRQDLWNNAFNESMAVLDTLDERIALSASFRPVLQANGPSALRCGMEMGCLENWDDEQLPEDSSGGKLLPIYKNHTGGQYVDMGLLAALPESLAPTALSDVSYLLVIEEDTAYYASYQLGGKAYKIVVTMSITDLEGNTVISSEDSLTGGTPPSIIHYIGNAYGDTPSDERQAEVVKPLIYDFADVYGIDISGWLELVDEPLLAEKPIAGIGVLQGSWTGGGFSDAYGECTATAEIGQNGSGTFCFQMDENSQELHFRIQSLSDSHFSIVFEENDLDYETGEIEFYELGTDSGEIQLYADFCESDGTMVYYEVELTRQGEEA